MKFYVDISVWGGEGMRMKNLKNGQFPFLNKLDKVNFRLY
jgi:hypothetical protein